MGFLSTNERRLTEAVISQRRSRCADLATQRVVRAYIGSPGRYAPPAPDFAPLGCSRPQARALRAAEAFGGDAQLQSRWAHGTTCVF